MATGKLGEKITCCVCLETITRTGPNQVQCNRVCKPHPNALIKCTICGKDKHPSEFYDQRYNIEGRLMHRCRSCLIKENASVSKKRHDKMFVESIGNRKIYRFDGWMFEYYHNAEWPVRRDGTYYKKAGREFFEMINRFEDISADEREKCRIKGE